MAILFLFKNEKFKMENEKFKMENEKFKLENEKFKLENEKNERFKNRMRGFSLFARLRVLRNCLLAIFRFFCV